MSTKQGEPYTLDYYGVQTFNSLNECNFADTRCKNRTYGKRGGDPFVAREACIQVPGNRWTQTCVLEPLRVSSDSDAEKIIADFRGSYDNRAYLAFTAEMCKENSWWKSCGGSGISTTVWILLLVGIGILVYKMTHTKTKKKYNK